MMYITVRTSTVPLRVPALRCTYHFFLVFVFVFHRFYFSRMFCHHGLNFREMSYSYYLECENMMITIIIVFIGVLLSLCSLLPSRMHDPVFFPGGLSCLNASCSLRRVNPQADPKMPKSRKLLAVPFVGKDVPSRASEFSHPDVVIGEVRTVWPLTEQIICAFEVSPWTICCRSVVDLLQVCCRSVAERG